MDEERMGSGSVESTMKFAISELQWKKGRLSTGEGIIMVHNLENYKAAR